MEILGLTGFSLSLCFSKQAEHKHTHFTLILRYLPRTTKRNQPFSCFRMTFDALIILVILPLVFSVLWNSAEVFLLFENTRQTACIFRRFDHTSFRFFELIRDENSRIAEINLWFRKTLSQESSTAELSAPDDPQYECSIPFVDWIFACLPSLITPESVFVEHSVKRSLNSASKRIRSRLCEALCHQVDESLILLSSIVELEHNASLIHDDIVDSSKIRRGKHSHCKIFGNKVAVLHADYVVSKMILLMTRLHSKKITISFSKSMHDLVTGELLQLKNSDSGVSSSESAISEYLVKSRCKTGSVFAAVGYGTSLIAGFEENSLFAAFGSDLGTSFQVVDDNLNFSWTHEKPSAASDLRVGCLTGPCIYILHSEYIPCKSVELRRKGLLHLLLNSRGLRFCRYLAGVLLHDSCRRIIPEPVASRVKRLASELFWRRY